MISCLYGSKITCCQERSDTIKQIVVRLNDDNHQKLKIKVIKDNTSVQAFLEEIITAYVNSEKTSSEINELIKK